MRPENKPRINRPNRMPQVAKVAGKNKPSVLLIISASLKFVPLDMGLIISSLQYAKLNFRGTAYQFRRWRGRAS